MRDPRLLAPVICRLLTNTEIQRQECVSLMREILEKGYAVVPRSGMRRKTGEMLVKKGVLTKVRIEYCTPQYGRRGVKAYILNVDTVRSIYELLQALKPPPLCIQAE